MIVVDILLILLWIVAGLLALLLVMPVSYRLAGAVDEADEDGAWAHARVGWAFNALLFQLCTDGMRLRVLGVTVWRRRLGERSDDKDEKKEKAEKKKKRPKKKKGKRGLRWALANKERLLRILGRYLRALHLKGRLEGELGLAQPDHTAFVHRLLVVLGAALPAGALRVELNWVEEVVSLRARLGGWLVPLQLLGITAWVFLNPKTWRALRAA